MNEQKNMNQTDAIQCSICHKTFHSQDELQKHNREFHPQGQMKDQGHAGSSSEQQSRAEQNQGGKSPNFDKGQDRKGPGSEQKHSEHEQRQPGQKRAAS